MESFSGGAHPVSGDERGQCSLSVDSTSVQSQEEFTWREMTMAIEKLRRLENSAPLAEGEFWRITGIGDATEKRLHSAGIDTFDQLGSLNPEEIASILTGQVGVKERVARQDWISQARRLAFDLKAAEKRTAAAESGESQHYESFLLELLIEDDRSIKRTKITQVRCGEKASWVGWDSERFFRWIAGQTDLPDELFGLAKAPTEPAVLENTPPVPSTAILPADIVLSALDSHQNKRFYDAGQPLELQLTLDLTGSTIPAGAPLTCHAVAEARNVVTGRSTRIGEIQQTCAAADQIVLNIPIPGVEQGTYFLETAVHLIPTGDSAQAVKDGLSAIWDAGVVHIFACNLEPA